MHWEIRPLRIMLLYKSQMRCFFLNMGSHIPGFYITHLTFFSSCSFCYGFLVGVTEPASTDTGLARATKSTNKSRNKVHMSWNAVFSDGPTKTEPRIIHKHVHVQSVSKFQPIYQSGLWLLETSLYWHEAVGDQTHVIGPLGSAPMRRA
jgi:hypothetical protein